MNVILGVTYLCDALELGSRASRLMGNPKYSRSLLEIDCYRSITKFHAASIPLTF